LGLESSPQFRPLEAYRRSLAQTIDSPFRVCLTGHGPPVVDHVALIERRLVEQEARAGLIVDVLERSPGRTAWEVAVAVFGDEVTEKLPMLCFSEAIAHLESLEGDGKIARESSEPVRFV